MANGIWVRLAGMAGMVVMLLTAGCERRVTAAEEAAPAPPPPVAAAAAPGPRADGDLTAFPVRPLSQSVELRIDPDESGYAGRVAIELEVTDETDRFAFHARDMELGKAVLVAETGAAAGLQTESGAHGLVTATTGRALAPGRYRLELDFERPYEGRAVGLYRVSAGGENYLFTQFQAVDARRAFPCWDEPRYKIPFRMTLSAPAGDVVLFNTPVSSKRTEDGWTTHVFAETPPVSTYFLAIAAGPFDAIPIAGMDVPGSVYAVRGQAGLGELGARMTPPILQALEAYFGRPYPYRKLDYVAVPDYWPGAMENAGLITYRDRLLLVDEDSASVAQRRSLAIVIAHELAHMWFGDLVTLTWWDDLWLNESFASWMAGKVVRERYPAFRTELSDARSTEYAMVTDARPSTSAIRREVTEPADIMEDLGLAYSKGQAVLEMVEAWIGPDVFRDAVLDYLEAHAWGNAEAGDLWRALAEASGEDVPGVLAGFLEQSGVPLLVFEPSGTTGVRVTQQRFLNAGVEAEERAWSIPVTLRYGTADDTQTTSFLLKDSSREVQLGEGVEWVVPNADSVGYFRWELPREDLLELAGAATERMTPRERISFLGNARALLLAGRLGGDDFLRILADFGADADPDVVTAVLSGLDSVRDWFVPDERHAAFGRWLGETLEPALDRYGLQPVAGEPESVQLLRPSLIRALGMEAGRAEVLAYAEDLAETYLSDPSGVDPSLASAALDVAARHGDRALYERYLQALRDAASPVERSLYLGSLGAFQDPDLQRAALALALSDEVRNTELGSIVGSLPDTEAAETLRWEWLQENYGAIAARLPEMFVPALVGFAGGCSRERLAQAEAFFMAPERRVDGVAAQLAKLEDRVADCVRLRERAGAQVGEYLAAQ
ncbi:MAG: M1 family metallopeptidase [Gammaproteobacteria bacterium]